MNALEIINYANQANIVISAHDSELIIDAPKGCISEEFRQCLVKHKPALLKKLSYYGLNEKELEEHAEEDWEDLKNNQPALIAYAEILHEQKIMRAGEVPPRFTAITFCVSCNKSVPVSPSLAKYDKVLGCPWCAIRQNLSH